MSEAAFYQILKDGEGPYAKISQFIGDSVSGEQYYKARRAATFRDRQPTRR